MTERIGIVIENESDHHAQVVTDRHTVCGECSHKKSACHGCLSSSKVVSRVANPVGAKKGDLVNIHLSSDKLFTAAALFYLLPVFTLLAGAFSGIYTSTMFGITEAAASMGGAAAGLAAGLMVVTVLGRMPGISRRIEPSITSVVMPKEMDIVKKTPSGNVTQT